MDPRDQIIASQRESIRNWKLIAGVGFAAGLLTWWQSSRKRRGR